MKANDKTHDIMTDRIIFLFQVALAVSAALCMAVMFIVHGLLAAPRAEAVTALTGIMFIISLCGVREAIREYREVNR